jgi:hypothetical protein
MEQYNSESDESALEKGKTQPDSGSLVACWVVNPKIRNFQISTHLEMNNDKGV